MLIHSLEKLPCDIKNIVLCTETSKTLLAIFCVIKVNVDFIQQLQINLQ
jgi:hypothetical protein